jgi:hypothetical protein
MNQMEKQDTRDPLDYHGFPNWVRANYFLLDAAGKRNVWLRSD